MKTKKPSIDAQLAVAEKAARAAFSEMINAIDAYCEAAPLEFIEGRETTPAWYILDQPDTVLIDPKLFGKFHAWIEKWMGALYPATLDMQRLIAADKAGDDEYMELCYDAQRFAYVLGYLMGCRAMGASAEHLQRKVDAYMLYRLPQLRHYVGQKAKGS